VTRGILFEIAPEAGVSIAEQTLNPEDLYKADEIFISSTNRNLIRVGEVAGHAIPSGAVAKQLDDLFEAYISDYVTRRAAAAR